MHRIVSAVAFAGLLASVPTTSSADPQRCRAEIAKASSKFFQGRLKALKGCEDKVLKGRLPPATDCLAEAKTAARIAKLGAKLRASLDKRCGGNDKTCGQGSDDDDLSSLGWTSRTCPDFENKGCTNQIRHCGDIAECLICTHGGAADQIMTLYDQLNGTAAANTTRKCQQEIAKATIKYASTQSKVLQKCWDKVNKGKATAPCPDPGDAKTLLKLEKAESKLVAAICKRCGGADKRCDDAVGAVGGTGGGDDLTAAQIGFGPNCEEVTIPGSSSSCAAPVRSLADIVSCALCVPSFKATCLDRLTVPWSETYPTECTDLVYAEHFDGDPDGNPWPEPWVVSGGVDASEILSSAARFRPSISGYSLARMYAPMNEQDLDIRYTFEFGDDKSQGIGFYARSNGGYLHQTSPAGEGYALFIERFRDDDPTDPNAPGTPGIGLWYEENGNEIPLRIDFGTVAIEAGTRYRARFRIHQSGQETTVLRGKMWPENETEPAAWDVEFVDDDPGRAFLQGLRGGIALDAWSDHTDPNDPASYMLVDDIEVRRLRNPLEGIGEVTAIQETFLFAEGPRWRAAEGVLLFSDIQADTIYRLTPPATIDTFRTPSAGANGLANDSDGDLIAAEHTARRLSVADPNGIVTPLVDRYQGNRFNSPNDIAVRSDGVVYFTDPDFGLADPNDREIPFNGLYRVPAGGTAVAEWEGDAVANGPNGVALSPDENTLYLADSTTGTLEAFDVGTDGSLSNPRTLASGMTIPDGLCVDMEGNIYVATWANTVEVFSANGDRWGGISLPGAATNCTFGGADRRTLYLTTQNGLYRVSMSIPGVP